MLKKEGNEAARAASWTAASDMSYPVRTPGYRDDDPDLLLAIALSKSLMARPPLEQALRLSTDHKPGLLSQVDAVHHEDECEPALPGKDFLADDESDEHHANKRTLAVRLLAHHR